MKFSAARYVLLYNSVGWTIIKRGFTSEMGTVKFETINTVHCFDIGIRRMTVTIALSVAKF